MSNQTDDSDTPESARLRQAKMISEVLQDNYITNEKASLIRALHVGGQTPEQISFHLDLPVEEIHETLKGSQKRLLTE